ncbi:MAG: hypothetical protein H5T83_13165 [Actinotalea sp.]|nr:hypothetical protein [Actinotalea sp.]
MQDVDLLPRTQLEALLPGALRARTVAESPESRRRTGARLLVLLAALDRPPVRAVGSAP